MMQDPFLSIFTKHRVWDLPGDFNYFKYSLTHNPSGAAYWTAEQVHDPCDMERRLIATSEWKFVTLETSHFP